MVEGGRNLESEIMESFYEELGRDNSLPDDVTERLQTLARRNELTDAEKVIELIKGVIADEHSRNQN